MLNLNSLIVRVSLLFTLLFSSITTAQTLTEAAPELENIDVIEHLGKTIPLDLNFINSAGESIPLSTYFHNDKPVLLVLAYYECPMLCTLVLNGLGTALDNLSYTPGDDFQILTISIDPDETYDLAQLKQDQYSQSFIANDTAGSWQFFVDENNNVQTLADALGFQYFYDEERDEYAHPAVIFMLSEKGKISRYLYGINFKTNDIRMGLLEASEGRIGNTIDRILLYCFHYDPDKNSYVVFAGNLMRLGGLATVLIMGVFFSMLWYRERFGHRTTRHKR